MRTVELGVVPHDNPYSRQYHETVAGDDRGVYHSQVADDVTGQDWRAPELQDLPPWYDPQWPPRDDWTQQQVDEYIRLLKSGVAAEDAWDVANTLFHETVTISAERDWTWLLGAGVLGTVAIFLANMTRLRVRGR